MAQVAELDTLLKSHARAPLTAAALQMTGAPLHPVAAGGLPGSSVLVSVSWQGSPEFPDIYGHFGPGADGSLRALLHTAALDRLARHLGVRQHWGFGRPGSSPR